MNNPFCGISDPKQLRALVQDGVECGWCGGSGVYTGEDDRLHIKIKCTTCHGTGLVPLPNADLNALTACWCEGIFVRNRIWEDPKNYTHYVLNPPEYAVRGNWVSPPAYTTDPVAAMRLMVKYHLDPTPILTGNNQENWKVHGAYRNESSQVKNTIEDLCHALTECALIEVFTAAMEGASE